MLSLKPAHLARYASVAKLLFKYGRSDIAQQIGLEIPTVEPSMIRDPGAGPEALAHDLEQLGPTFIKLGQLLSTRPDFLPPDYLDALARLQDDVEPIPYYEIARIVERELGARISKAFQEFETTAYACASIGQVHRATLRDGRRVAVKIQRPDIAPQIAQDLDALQELATTLDAHTQLGRRVRFEQIIESLREVMLMELDYCQEAENCRSLHRNLKNYETIVVPQVVDGYTTEKVLTTEYIEGAKITDLSQVVLLELDRKKTADDLFRVYLQQVLVDGLFHADPHPGNLLLLPDGRIALIDFGMVARVTPDVQRQLVKLLMAIADGRSDEAAEAGLAIGRPFERGHFREAEYRERLAKIVAANRGRPLERMRTGRVIMELNAVAGETGLKLPSALLMLGKTLMNLEKVVMVLDPSFDPNHAVQQHAGEIFREHGRTHMSWSRMYQTLLESAEFAERLPERLNKIADLITQNKLRVNVDALDELRLIAGMQKIANRITAGLILASMIIGASLMMHLNVQPTLFGYPLIAMLFFLGAAAASAVLLWRMAAGDETPE